MSKDDEVDFSIEKANAAAFRAISEEVGLKVIYTQEADSLLSDTAHLPQTSRFPTPEEIAYLRGESDKRALKRRYQDIALLHEQCPADSEDAALFRAMEATRLEVLGGRYMEGVKKNLNAYFLKEEYAAMDIDSGVLDPADCLRLLGRKALGGQEIEEKTLALCEGWEKSLPFSCHDFFKDAAILLEDQKSFGALVLDRIWQIQSGESKEKQKEEEDKYPPEEQDEQESEGNGVNEKQEEAENNDADMGDNVEDAATPDEDNSAEARQGAPREGSTFPSIEEGAQKSEDAGYRVWTTEFDRVVSAAELADSPEELQRLRKDLDEYLENFRGLATKCANRLQRRLMAKQRRHWEFDLEEGMLDPSRLVRIVTNPGHPFAFRQEKEMDFRDTVVSILIDNSGSMRGRPITIAAMSVEILAYALERCGICTEILGFTTSAWKGGLSREAWISAGKPLQPGRLNDVLYIVYKHVNELWRVARPHLGLMLREGLLKENIDGEALQWAAQRLLSSSHQRKILMVISDGAPVDDSTLSTNPSYYLERHIKAVISSIEERMPIELLAIGIGHDVTRYYKRAVTLSDAAELAYAMTSELASLFDQKPNQKPIQKPIRGRFWKKSA